MLTSLTIRDVVLIEALGLDFSDGLGVLTGETGAGKSILLDSLGLALGERGDAGLVRAGAPQAAVTAGFDVPAGHPVLTLLADSGIDADGQVILRRQVRADGGSRAWINDQSVSAGLLRDAGALLVEIHGQNAERGLLNPRGHRALLDAYGGMDMTAVAAAYAAWRDAEQQLAAARDALANGARERDWLDHSLAELRALKPKPGEEADLADARATMLKGQRLSDDLALVTKFVSGPDGGLDQLRQAARRLDRLAPELDQLAAALAALDLAVNEASEAEDRLADAAEALAYDPVRLENIESRLFDLRGLARKHRVDVDHLADYARELTARAEALDAGEAGLERLEAAVSASRATCIAENERLRALRQASAARLDSAVAAELVPLRLDAARFRTCIDVLPESGWSAMGSERVEFEISTNPGAAFAPLTRIASGGEMSRFTLALKVALAEAGSAGTIIFDEIDRGVGGAVASAIGDRLARLATRTQVLVVTHSPQVAARGGHQWLIAKSSTGAVTRTDVRRLDDGERREEIARMLSGASITDEARAQASRLLAPA